MINHLKDFIKIVDNYPKEGIKFRDVSGLLESPEVMNIILSYVTARVHDITCVVGLESRGFLFGMAIAQELHVPFIMCRKAGKLPGDCVHKRYDLEYGSAEIEIQCDAPISGNVLIVDDLLATGGTMAAAVSLVEYFLPDTITTLNIVEINDEGLEGRKFLEDMYPMYNHITIING